MNTDNYGTREVCEKLFAAGIVLETDVVWWRCHTDPDEWVLRSRVLCGILMSPETIPAPLMTEVWRELPEFVDGNYISICKIKRNTFAYCGAPWNAMRQEKNTNPTDALIDLLIWTVKERKGK